MANEVRINVTADTRQAEDGLKTINRKLEGTTPQVKGLATIFSGLTKSMALFGIGALSIGAGVKALVGSTGEAAKAAAGIDQAYERLPENLKAVFDKLKPEFDRLSGEFLILEDDIATALLTLLEATRDPSTNLGDLEGVLGRVAGGYGDVISEALLWAQAMLGDPTAIKELTKNFEGLDEAAAGFAKSGKDSRTVFDEMAFELKKLGRNAGGAFDAFSRGDYREALGDFISLLGDLKSLIDLNPFAGLSVALAIVKLATLQARLAFGLLKDAIGFVRDLAGELPFEWISKALTQPRVIILLAKDAFDQVKMAIESIRSLGGTNPFQWITDQLQPVFGIIDRLIGAFNGLRNRIGLGGGGNNAPPQRVGPNDPQLPRPIPRQPGEGDDGIFHEGGIIGGPRGVNRRITAQAGEGVFTRGQMAAMGGGGGGGNFTLIVEGDLVVDTEARVDTFVRKVQDKLTQLDRGGQGI